ncbi:MAG TPA: iron-sulfur cluster repair di-iron protein [Pyrinomonadaceae bacterium]|nr:iron-sulfur cluster repair di-iron protein [Pyrinomonadaceae bacterium]
MNLESNRTVGELALQIPGATRVFEKVGIDYCCGGNNSLESACAKAGVTVQDVRNSLELAKASGIQTYEPNFVARTLADLIGHIVESHHVFTKSEIQRLRLLIDKVFAAHGQNHPELGTLRALFETLRSELEPHMMKEERILFPYVLGMEDGIHKGRPVWPPPFGKVANPVRMMMLEHDNAGQLLKEMRELTSDYTVPSDACISYDTLYHALDAFEKDLHQHIHLENNILFPRAMEMEEKLRGN